MPQIMHTQIGQTCVFTRCVPRIVKTSVGLACVGIGKNVVAALVSA